MITPQETHTMVNSIQQLPPQGAAVAIVGGIVGFFAAMKYQWSAGLGIALGFCGGVLLYALFTG